MSDLPDGYTVEELTPSDIEAAHGEPPDDRGCDGGEPDGS